MCEKTRSFAVAGLGMAAMLSSAGVWAADNAGPPASPASGASNQKIEEVVVTARRRAEALQSVPVAVTAVTGETLEKNSVESMLDLRKVAPSLYVAPAQGRDSSPSIGIRSLREPTVGISQDPEVALYFADAVAHRMQGFGRQLYDLDNVQVLKGPQGTLFGRSSTGGAVLVNPRRPTQNFEGMAEVTLGNFDRRGGRAVLNVPVTDKLAIRLAGAIDKRDGYGINLTNGQRLGALDNYSGRLGILWKPTDSFENYFVGDLYHANNSPIPARVVAFNPNPPPFLAFLNIQPINHKPIDEVTHDNRLEFDRSRAWGITNISQLQLGSVTLKNIVGYRQSKANDNSDLDNGPVNFASGGIYQKPRQFTEEFQIIGNALNSRLSYIVGANYFQEHINRITYQAFDSPFYVEVHATAENYSAGVYASGTYSIMDDLRFTGGARWTWDERNMTVGATNFIGACALTTAPPGQPIPGCQFHSNKSFTEPTYTVSLDYKPTKDIMVYITHRRGYRSGGFNSDSTVDAAAHLPYRPEVVKDVELGVKSDFDVGAMPVRANLALVHAEYSQIQRGSTGSAPGVLFISTITNAASADIDGVELDLVARPIRDLEITGNFTWSKARYTNYHAVLPGLTVDLTGGRFGASPDFTGSFALDYTFGFLPENIGKVSFNANLYAQSWRQVSDIPEPGRIDMPAYYELGMRAEWKNILESHASLAAFVSNATDQRHLVDATGNQRNLGFTNGFYNEPRTYGVSIGYEW